MGIDFFFSTKYKWFILLPWSRRLCNMSHSLSEHTVAKQAPRSLYWLVKQFCVMNYWLGMRKLGGGQPAFGFIRNKLANKSGAERVAFSPKHVPHFFDYSVTHPYNCDYMQWCTFRVSPCTHPASHRALWPEVNGWCCLSMFDHSTAFESYSRWAQRCVLWTVPPSCWYFTAIFIYFTTKDLNWASTQSEDVNNPTNGSSVQIL